MKRFEYKVNRETFFSETPIVGDYILDSENEQRKESQK